MKKYVAYGIGAALVDTEIKVQDSELDANEYRKGPDDPGRRGTARRELLGHLEGHLVKANHASGGSAGNSMIATAQFGGPTFMSCKVANDTDGDIYMADLEAAGVDHCLNGGPRRRHHRQMPGADHTRCRAQHEHLPGHQ